ncbi:MAG: hypothetical protein J6569_06705 [Gilliamella sp.]|uniref:hypothetical protein n=1 Tax=Gilliamella sp. TaxID=1891236 RepID=UPI0025DCF72E|nr:hypothetical protein [Gilliamella sp.]MCO6539807.1 hypothetical protein [Gilliamella sp.]
MANFNPEMYTITIRQENCHEGLLYVGRVSELPDVIEYGDSFNEVRELVIDTLITSKEAFDNMGLEFPKPKVINDGDDCGGRLTLRLSNINYSKTISNAKEQGVSVNGFIIEAITRYIAYIESTKDIRHILTFNNLTLTTRTKVSDNLTIKLQNENKHG